MVKITLKTKCLSVNKAWRGGPRYRTQEYKDFENEVAWLLPKNMKRIDGPVHVSYKFFVKNHKMSDCDNFIKPLTDVLVKLGAMNDDRNIYKITAEKIPSVDEYVEISIESL